MVNKFEVLGYFLTRYNRLTIEGELMSIGSELARRWKW